MNDETFFANGREFYSSNRQPVWPNRHRQLPDMQTGTPKRALKDESYVHLILDELDDLERKTRPSEGDGSSHRKDFAAFEALEFAGKLVSHVAGWAIDHQVGIAAEGLKFVPMQPSGTRDHPQYILEQSKVDSHLHERAGGQVDCEDIDPLFARKCLVNILRANPGAMPTWLQRLMIESLESLNYGEVRPVLASSRDYNKRDLTALRLQLQAVGMVAYRRALGANDADALEEVGQGFHVSGDTIKSWRHRLRVEFGRLEVDRTISFAKNAASWVKNARKRRGEEVEDTNFHAEAYDDDALIECGKRWRQANDRR